MNNGEILRCLRSRWPEVLVDRISHPGFSERVERWVVRVGDDLGFRAEHRPRVPPHTLGHRNGFMDAVWYARASGEVRALFEVDYKPENKSALKLAGNPAPLSCWLYFGPVSASAENRLKLHVCGENFKVLSFPEPPGFRSQRLRRRC